MLGGAILSLFALSMISSNPSGITVALGVVAGMIIGQGVRTAVTRR
jgi:outer membrane lipoprotein SlyB